MQKRYNTHSGSFSFLLYEFVSFATNWEMILFFLLKLLGLRWICKEGLRGGDFYYYYFFLAIVPFFLSLKELVYIFFRNFMSCFYKQIYWQLILNWNVGRQKIFNSQVHNSLTTIQHTATNNIIKQSITFNMLPQVVSLNKRKHAYLMLDLVVMDNNFMLCLLLFIFLVLLNSLF